jgi:hypothetical protein
MPTVDRALAWLAEVATDPNGRVHSWRRDGEPSSGYPYPEASALYLHQLALDRNQSPRASRVADSLIADYQSQRGIGKDGKLYAFDAGVALTALHARGEHHTICEEIANDLANSLNQRRASSDWPADAAPRWSRFFGPHLLKSCARLLRCAPQYGDIARDCFTELSSAYVRGRFESCGSTEPTYLHAQMYSLEGLSLWDQSGREQLSEGLDWVASIQDECGGIRAWHDGEATSGPLRLDASCQALRLWSAVDPGRYRSNRIAALKFIERQQHFSGGFPYEPASPDLNSWCTLFAVQAIRWSRLADAGQRVCIEELT